MIQAIVFAPLLAALIAGLGNRMIGNTAAKAVTTAGALLRPAPQRPPLRPQRAA